MFRPDTWAHIRVLVTPHAVCVCVCIHARTQHIHINAPAKLCSILFEGDPSQVAQAADHADKTDTRPKMPKSLTSESPASVVSTIMVSLFCFLILVLRMCVRLVSRRPNPPTSLSWQSAWRSRTFFFILAFNFVTS